MRQSAIPSNRSHLRVMVVDDRESITLTFQWMLETLGYDVRVANNGQDAIAIAQEFLPHVVLLDIGLPDMDGYELCGRLRAEAGLEKSVFVAQTGHTQPEHRERSRIAGFDHFLVKPIVPEHLNQLLTSINTGSAA